MASDLAAPQQQYPSQSDSMDTSSQDASFDAPMINGDHAPTSDNVEQDDTTTLDAPASAQPAATETAIDTKMTGSFQADPNPAGPTPIDDVVSGIQPVSSFIPKEASNLSHPTPPPEEPLGSGEADVDMETPAADLTEEVNVSSLLAPAVSASPSEPPLASSEPSLVRPREDDGEDQPAAKRSRLHDDDATEMIDAASLPADAQRADERLDESTDPAAALMSEAAATPFTETAPALSIATEPTALSTEEAAAEPSSIAVEPSSTQADSLQETRPETQPEFQVESHSELAESQVQPVTEETTQPESEAQAQSDAKPSEAATESMDISGPADPITASPTEDKPAAPTAAVKSQPTGEAAPQESRPTYSTAPLTSMQKSSLVDKMKNLKKTKSSGPFLRPVDPVAFGIPTYPDIISHPMDLGTMETKLKESQYASVQDFVNDFELIVNNTLRFNGPNHAVTVNGFNMRAYFDRMMQSVPPSDAIAQPKVQKRRSPSLSREKPPRRESRAAAAPAVAPAPSTSTAPVETYALQSDGTPQIRRQSSNRPARAIKPPTNREISYAKPKRKEHQLELRFAEHALDEIRGPRYGQVNHVFLQPVDPVALNIPHYRQVIKTPMDLGTMAQKLKQGQYGTAAEVKKDFDLMIKNCLIFNPAGNPVRDLGIALQRDFELIWATKEKWEQKNQPPSNRASSASGEDDSEADEEEEEEDEETDAQAKIRALQKQLAEMQNALSGLAPDKALKSKKSKSSKSATKKAGSMSAAPKTKAPSKPPAKPKKSKQVTYDEKQEISEAVGKMDDKQVQRLTEIITQNCAKYRDMEEMELEIDDLPNDVQVMLLEYVRKIFGNPNKKKVREPSPEDAAALDDDDFEPERGARAGKRKKHRPMGKKEQQDAIKNIESKLAQFSQAATSGSQSPANSSFNASNVKDETSGDEESEESEEE